MQPTAEQLATIPPVPPTPEPPSNTVVIAKSAGEMEIAQRQLVTWVDRKLEAERALADEAATNLEMARVSGWKLAPFKKALARAQGRVTYYVKMKAALDAGYVIMPDIPCGVFAVRTTADGPNRREHESRYHTTRLPEATASEAPAGEGRYVDPSITYTHWTDSEKREGSSDLVKHHARAVEDFDAPDFPLQLVKPQILDETSKAMALRIFDEIGILPEVPTSKKMLRGYDPIVLGRIVRTEGTMRHTCAFLITWWLDTAAL